MNRCCSVEDCGRPVRARGWCNPHWHRWYRHGDPLGGRPRIPLRWEARAGSLLVTATGGEFLVDPGSEDLLRAYRWYVDRRARTIPYVRAAGSSSGHVYLHRLVLGAPPGMHVDHINADSLDNRVINLRLCSQSGNQANQRKRTGGVSQYKGVSLSRNSQAWRAQIGVDYQNLYLGSFRSEKEAARAYDAAARRYFGEFARLNFPEVAP